MAGFSLFLWFLAIFGGLSSLWLFGRGPSVARANNRVIERSDEGVSCLTTAKRVLFSFFSHIETLKVGRHISLLASARSVILLTPFL